MIKLWIENQELDTTEGFSHQITYAVDDLNNLDSKATSFSKTIVLPGTANNNFLLGNIFEFANSNFTGQGDNVGYNFNASRSAKCRLDINGLTIIKGVLRLLEIVRDGDSIEYEVAIFGELGGFVSKLANKKLEDLDFSAYNHNYTVNNIISRWDKVQDMVFYGTGFDDVVNEDYLVISYLGDLSTIIFPGDQIQVIKVEDDTNVGTATVTSVIYNPSLNNVIINVTDGSYFNVSSIFFKYIVLNKGGCGVYYPLIDYGNYSTNKLDYKYKTFRPALFLREYMHKIITGVGYTYKSRFFETDFFKRLIIPHNESILQTIKSDLFNSSVQYTRFLDDSSTAGYVYQIIDDIPFSINYGEVFTTSDNKVFTYTGASTTANFNVSLRSAIHNVSSLCTYNLTVTIYKNGSATSITFNASGSSDANGQAWVNINLNGNLSITTNDTISVHFQLDVDSVINSFFVFFYTYSENSTFTIVSQYPTTAPIALNDLVELSRAIPKNIMQKDFFTSVMKLFNLMVTEDKYRSNHLLIEPNVWFYNLNPSSYLNWSNKLDRSQPIKIRPMSEVNARYYDFKYKSDSDYYNDLYKKRYNEGYGDRKYDNELEFAKDSQSSEVIFASTPLIGYPDRDKIIPYILKWNGTYGGGGYPTNEERVNSIIRIMQVKKITEVSNWAILNDAGNAIEDGLTEYPYAGHFDDPDAPASDLNYGATKELFFTLSAGALGNNLFNTYYSPYMAEITDKDSRLVTAKFKLNDTDIFNLDFRRFIYLDGVLYRLSRIVDYTPGEICTVELLRVIYTTYDSSINSADIPEVTICGQVWSQKNLDTEYYRNGDLIPQITDPTDWSNATEGAWCYYANSTTNGIEYGKLYNWYAVNDARGLAPEGWRIPKVSDFRKLKDSTCYNDDGKRIKEPGSIHWNTADGTNQTKFTALGSGKRKDSGTFQELKDTAYYWTEDNVNTNNAKYYYLADAGTFDDATDDKNAGMAIRLIRE